MANFINSGIGMSMRSDSPGGIYGIMRNNMKNQGCKRGKPAHRNAGYGGKLRKGSRRRSY